MGFLENFHLKNLLLIIFYFTLTYQQLKILN